MEPNISIISNPAVSISSKQQQRKAGRTYRPPQSCALCRNRKLKCDRKEPCANCITRRETCSYAGSRRPVRGASTPNIRPQHVESMQERIDHLESLVKRIASRDVPKNPIKDPCIKTNGTTHQNGTEYTVARADENNSTDEIRHGVGVMRVSQEKSQYRGSTHWGDVFQELNELKNVWARVQEDPGDPDFLNLDTSFSSSISVANGAPLLYSGFKSSTFHEIHTSIPERPVLDKLIDRVFDEYDSPLTALHCLHKPTFMQEYEAYWANPEETKVMWVGMLFSLMALVMLSYHLMDEEPPEYEGLSEGMFDVYSLRTAQCLALGDITKGAPYTMETLLFYGIGEQARKSDGGTGVWIMFGTIIRVAQQMGYHRESLLNTLTDLRDPSQYPEISILQGEMRRRVWFFIVRLDSVLSFQTGLPGMVRANTYDTAVPRNLYDWDLSESMTKLPPSRPSTDSTPIIFLLSKDGILLALGKIVDFLCALGPYSYDRVLELDDELSLAQSQLPPYLHMRPLEDSMNDPKSLIGRRVQLEMLFHQGMCVLHRKFMVQGRIDGRFAPSRRRCIRSAMALISIQGILYQEARGTVNDKIRFTRHWYRFSFTSQDFILSAMILCLDLRSTRVSVPGARLEAGLELEEEKKIAAIKTAFRIWEYAQKSLPEVSKVYRVLCYMIETLGIGDQVGLQPASNSDADANHIHPALLHDEQTHLHVPEFEILGSGDGHVGFVLGWYEF
ncbi:hypothetical protein HYALB_00013455 [Hymenoscyphus albidus]|uniref:Zn(2)-C6 fungal-type domain-containing protein n=1 Tax=Hymenoscyphus albidus TaxID=595503 RepID=A0A9N9LVX5_9HELO|nr:hypothetical protein HYALB_00013455 [Hymenoscyphus albidus]